MHPCLSFFTRMIKISFDIFIFQSCSKLGLPASNAIDSFAQNLQKATYLNLLPFLKNALPNTE